MRGDKRRGWRGAALVLALGAASCGDGHTTSAPPSEASASSLATAIGGTWRATVTTGNFAPSPGTLIINVGLRSGQVSASCGNANITPASFSHIDCLSAYYLDLNGTFTTDDGAYSQMGFQGELTSYNPTLQIGFVTLKLDGGFSATLDFQPSQGFSNGALVGYDGQQVATLTLTR